MNKEEFLKELNHQLRYLNKKDRNYELEKYANLEDYNLNPKEIAKSIYNSYNIPVNLDKETLFNSVNIIINKLQSKNQKIILNILKFFLYLLFLLIVIKIPFIYIRDLLGTFFENSFTNNSYIIWNLAFELLYALTTIIIFINLIKKKALELKKK